MSMKKPQLGMSARKTVGLKYLKEWEPNWAVLLAGASLSIVPIVIVFLIFQKQFMASTMNSGFGGK